MADGGRQMRARLVCAVAAAVCLLPGAAWSQGETQEGAPHGMPQLDFANPLTISQIVWLVVIFGVLYLLLSTWALPRVGRVIESRASRIGADLEGARAAKQAADHAATEAEEAGRRAHAQAQSRINDAVSEAKARAADHAASLNATLDARIAAADAAIAEARREAMAGLNDVAAAAAASMVERLSGRPADRFAIDGAIAAAHPTAA